MIKLGKLMSELALKKNKWTSIPSNELKAFEKNILDLIKTAYKPIGGNPKFQSLSDVEQAEYEYTVLDLDDDDEPEAVTVTKKGPGGDKSVAMGHDGSSPAKRASIGRKVKMLKTKGHYIEVSGKLKDILLASGIPVVDDEKTIKKLLKGKDFTLNADGTYARKIAGKLYTKTIMGKPKT